MAKLDYARPGPAGEAARFARWLIGASLLGPGLMVGHALLLSAHSLWISGHLPVHDDPYPDGAHPLVRAFVVGAWLTFVGPAFWLAALAVCVGVRPRLKAIAYATVATAGQLGGWLWLLMDPLGAGGIWVD